MPDTKYGITEFVSSTLRICEPLNEAGFTEPAT